MPMVDRVRKVEIANVHGFLVAWSDLWVGDGGGELAVWHAPVCLLVA